MTKTAPLSFDRGSEQVEHIMEQGMPFACVEDLIDGAALPWDHKAALWLLAWSLRDPVLQRRDARLTVRLLSGGGSPPAEAAQARVRRERRRVGRDIAWDGQA